MFFDLQGNIHEEVLLPKDHFFNLVWRNGPISSGDQQGDTNWREKVTETECQN